MYPRKIEYWICSDKRTFPTEAEANAHEKFLEQQAKNPTAYNQANTISWQDYDFWF